MDMQETVEAWLDPVWDRTHLLLIVPALVLLFAVGVTGYQYAKTGQVLEKGLEFSGGTEITVQANTTETAVGDAFNTDNVRTLQTDQGTQYTVETRDELDTSTVENRLNQAGIAYSDISVRSFGASVSQAFLTEAVIAVGVAFLIMSTVVFIAFREWVPSVAIIFAAVTDIVFAIAMMIILNIELAFGSLAALLMLIGYSVDTDIMLSTKMLKNIGEDLQEQFAAAVLTGSTMSLAAVAAFTVLYFVSTAAVLDQIALVIIWGLLIDIIVTYFGNAVILKWYVER